MNKTKEFDRLCLKLAIWSLNKNLASIDWITHIFGPAAPGLWNMFLLQLARNNGNEDRALIDFIGALSNENAIKFRDSMDCELAQCYDRILGTL